jgi:hypothetical protein
MPATRHAKSPTVAKRGRPAKVKRGPKPKVKAPPSEEDEESVQDILEGRDDVKEDEDEEEEDIILTVEEAKERISSFRAMGTGRPFSQLMILGHWMKRNVQSEITKMAKGDEVRSFRVACYNLSESRPSVF